ncbi:MAG: DUF3179 domain-containing protein [Alphaproteobacteria bacterium]
MLALMLTLTLTVAFFMSDVVRAQFGRLPTLDSTEHPIIKRDWQNTDFEKISVSLSEIISGGPPKDGIPAIDDPQFEVAKQVSIGETEPLIRLSVGGETRAYPLRVLIWHEIVNDTIGGLPVAVTYCPLCNTSLVFDRRVDGQPARFGTTGLLRNSDLVMYDDLTESWWQQFSGEAIVGEKTGEFLPIIPSRVVSLRQILDEDPDMLVLVPNREGLRNYGSTPYVGYDDGNQRPFLYDGDLPEGIYPMAYVAVVDGEAWSFDFLRKENPVVTGSGVTLMWEAGVASTLDAPRIAGAKDIGTVTTVRGGQDVPHHVTFAFVYHAFTADGVLYHVPGEEPLRWMREDGSGQ